MERIISMLERRMRWGSMGQGLACAGMALMVGLMSGCATTQTYDYTNPRFSQAHYDRVVVYVNSYDLGLRKRLEARACQSLAPTPCLPLSALIMPGEEESLGHMLDVLQEQGQPALLTIEVNGDNSQANVVGYASTTSTQASAYGQSSGSWQGRSTPVGTGRMYQGSYQGNSYVHAQGSSSTFAAPITAYTRDSVASVQLMDVSQRAVAWKGQMNTHGAGLAAVGDGAMEHAQASDLAKHLQASGMLATPMPSASK